MSPPEPQTSTARGRLFAALSLAIFGGSLVAVVATPWCTADHVRDAEAFVQAVREAGPLVHAGDIVLVHPPWRDDVVDAIERAGVLPPGATATTAFAPRHGEGSLPALVVVRDVGAPDLPRVLMRSRDSEHAVRSGGVEVARIVDGRAPPGGEPRSDIRADADSVDLFGTLERAEVVVRAGARETKCAWSAGRARHACDGLPEWMYVGKTTVVVGGKPQACVWNHPITGGTVTTTFRSVPLRKQITVSAALSDEAAANPTGAPVSLRVTVGGADAGTLVRTNQPGFASATFAVPNGATRADVAVEVTTPADGQRHFCWRMTTDGA